MITHPHDNNDVLYTIASVLQQTYHHIKHSEGHKRGYRVIQGKRLISKPEGTHHFFNQNKAAEAVFDDLLEVISTDNLSDTFDTVQLQIKSNQDIPKNALYCFCPNPYVRELTRQLNQLFTCASALLADEEAQQILDIMAHHYSYAYQHFLLAPLGTFQEGIWSFPKETSAKQKIYDVFCLAQAILSHAINDLLVILRQYDKSSSIWIKLLSPLHKRSLYNRLLKAYQQAEQDNPEIHFYFFDIDYCTQEAFQVDPFLSLIPIDTNAVMLGAQSDRYQEILKFLDNPYKDMKNTVSSTLANELKTVVFQEIKDHPTSANEQARLANPWPYSYVPIPVDEFMKVEKKLNLKLNVITGNDAGVESIPEVIARITKQLKNPDEIHVQIGSQHNAQIELGNSISLNLATQYVEIEHDDFIEKFPALTLNAHLSEDSDPIVCMRHMIDLAIESHNPYFYIIGDAQHLELTQLFLVEALSIVKNNTNAKFRPRIIGLSSELIARLSKAACEQAGYPAQTFFADKHE